MNIFRAGKHIFDLNKKTLVMGILNITPDSFSDGGIYFEPEKAVKRAFEMQNAGADIIDIGGQSTRPGFTKISYDEEWQRLHPVLEGLKGKLEIPISVDTFYPEVARRSINFGAEIINDVNGFKNPEMFKVASKSDCGIVIMHSGSVKNMKEFFEFKLRESESYGISNERICFDVGIGFLGSRLEDRFAINNLSEFKTKNIALLVGISRKRVIAEYCGGKTENKFKLPGTIAANTIAIQNGANIIRVHDVEEAVFAARTTDAILKTKEII